MTDPSKMNEPGVDSWAKVKHVWSSLKSGVLTEQSDKNRLKRFYVWVRHLSLFSRRRSRSLVTRVLWILVIWGMLVYLLAIAGIWWGSSKVIEDNFSNQASEWVRKLDELGTPLFTSEDKVQFRSIIDHVARFPELSYLRYYEASNNSIIAEYKAEKYLDAKIPRLTPTHMELLRIRVEADEPLYVETAQSDLSLIQAAAPIVVRSIQSDGLMDFDLNAQPSENYKIIGFIELGLDFGLYREKLIKNISIGSLVIALFLVFAAIIGRVVIKRALSPLTSLRQPLDKLAKGDIDVTVQGEGDEEIVSIANALNTTITALKGRDEKLRKLANYDALTGLLNKHNFNIQLKQEMERVLEYRDSSALMFIDLDEFKYVNDHLGHAAGDRLLIQIADLLKGRMRTDDVIARFGGDEFTVIARSVSESDAIAIADSIVKSMQDFVFVEKDQAFNIYCSVGVVMINEQESSLEEVFSHADMACYEAKSEGRNRYHMYDAAEQAENRQAADIGWSKRIKDALNDDRFSLYYQPVIGLQDANYEYFEVLLRMRLPDEEIVYPNAFLPAADRLGFSVDVDYLVIQKAMRKIAECKAEGRKLRLSINLTARAFAAPDLVNVVEQWIKKYDIEPEQIVFEITEQTVMRQLDHAKERITELSDLGCHFALDDFGANFSSFSYLKHLPVDILKIDGDFVADMADDPVDQTMVQAMVKIAKTLNKQTVAKYVEDLATLELLRKYGVDYVQGNYFSKPEPVLNVDSYHNAHEKLSSNVVHL